MWCSWCAAAAAAAGPALAPSWQVLVKLRLFLQCQLAVVEVDALSVQPHPEGALKRIISLLVPRQSTTGLSKRTYFRQPPVPPGLVLGLTGRGLVPAGDGIQAFTEGWGEGFRC